MSPAEAKTPPARCWRRASNMGSNCSANAWIVGATGAEGAEDRGRRGGLVENASAAPPSPRAGGGVLARGCKVGVCISPTADAKRVSPAVDSGRTGETSGCVVRAATAGVLASIGGRGSPSCPAWGCEVTSSSPAIECPEFPTGKGREGDRGGIGRSKREGRVGSKEIRLENEAWLRFEGPELRNQMLRAVARQRWRRESACGAGTRRPLSRDPTPVSEYPVLGDTPVRRYLGGTPGTGGHRPVPQ